MKLRHLLMLPLLALDCLGNLLVGGSVKNTLSSEAWNHREHAYWGWTHRFIDGLPFFGKGHCKAQADREALYGGVWKAWSAQFTQTFVNKG